jgi:hypothetical protein
VGIKDDLITQLNNGANNVAEPADVPQEDEKIDIAESAHRAELVCKADILKVVEMDKMGLQKYADSRLGKKLDLSKKLKMLRTDVVIHIKNKLKIPSNSVDNATGEPAVEVEKVPEFIFNPKNRRVFEWTELLAKRTDLIECWLIDKEGKRL